MFTRTPQQAISEKLLTCSWIHELGHRLGTGQRTKQKGPGNDPFLFHFVSNYFTCPNKASVDLVMKHPDGILEHIHTCMLALRFAARL